MEVIRCPGCKSTLATITEMRDYDSYELTVRHIRVKNGPKVYLFCEICCNMVELSKENVVEEK